MLALLNGVAWAEPEPTPRDLIMTATQRLVDALQQNRRQIEKDPDLAYRLADAYVIPLVDFRRIARWVLGRHWKEASKQQRERFTDVFRRFLIKVYVTAMVTYADEIISHARDIAYPPLELAPGARDAVVRTVITLRGGMKVDVSYRMHRARREWRIYDVSALGISFATIYRSTLAPEIAQRGLDGLIDELETKIRSGYSRLPLQQ
jgi:phospholipid transport system substrate-binding protein